MSQKKSVNEKRIGVLADKQGMLSEQLEKKAGLKTMPSDAKQILKDIAKDNKENARRLRQLSKTF
jgi:hypothetical protein